MATSKEGNKQGGTSNRGFASMDPERQREIASEGGKAAHEKGTAHEFTSEEARRAGSMSHGNRQAAEGGSRSGGSKPAAKKDERRSGSRQEGSKQQGKSEEGSRQESGQSSSGKKDEGGSRSR